MPEGETVLVKVNFVFTKAVPVLAENFFAFKDTATAVKEIPFVFKEIRLVFEKINSVFANAAFVFKDEVTAAE